MGNPHAVVVLDEAVDLSAFPIEKTGPHFENHPAFPNRTNTEFVHVDSRSEVHMRVWERGTGETLACGTGCCATTVACILQGLTDDTVTVHVRGGDIRCRYDRAADKVFMTGPAVTVFEGEVTV
jgi:diaminopimelate epimerase